MTWLSTAETASSFAKEMARRSACCSTKKTSSTTDDAGSTPSSFETSSILGSASRETAMPMLCETK